MATRAVRARRSRYGLGHRLRGSAPVVVAAMLLVGLLAGGGLVTARVFNFVGAVSGGVSLGSISKTVLGDPDPDPGSLAWKVRHHQRINIALLGYGGFENDAPYLTDSIMIMSLDPASNRVALTSVPRDLWVGIPAFPGTRVYHEKINAAFEVGMDPSWEGKAPRFTGRDGGGHAAEDTLAKVTGLTFDRYAAVDFKAFRDVVNALGGATVCLDTALDDNEYPDYHDGYIPGGIHYRAGCQRVDGEHALQIARSRHAIQSAQFSDFGRARRQQQIVAAIKKEALSAGAILRTPQLMAALQHDFRTDMTIDDIKVLYDWSRAVDDAHVAHYAITDQNLVDADQCGQPAGGFALCPQDPTYATIRRWMANQFPPATVTAGQPPVQVLWGGNPSELGDRVADLLKPYGFTVAPAARSRSAFRTVVYDLSGGRYGDAAAWLARNLGGTVGTAADAPAMPTVDPAPRGLVVQLGHDFGMAWYNLSPGASVGAP